MILIQVDPFYKIFKYGADFPDTYDFFFFKNLRCVPDTAELGLDLALRSEAQLCNLFDFSDKFYARNLWLLLVA